MKNRIGQRIRGGLIVLLVLSGTSVFAESGTWTNAISGAWSNIACWASGVVADGAVNTATFAGPASGLTADTTITLEAPRTIGNLWFTNSNSRTWYLAGSNLTFDADGVGGSTSTVFVATSTAQFSQKMLGTTNSVLNKTGAGQLIINTSNSGCYSGRVVVAQGSLTLNNGHALASTRGLTLGGGDDNVSVSFANNNTQNGSTFTVAGGGTGSVTIAFGIANSLEFKPAIVLNKTAIFNCGANASLRLWSLPSGAGGVYKTGAGELMYYYNGGASYSGTTTVSQGSIMIWANNGAGFPSGNPIEMGDERTGANGVNIVLGGDRVYPNVKLHVTTNGTSATLTAGRNGSSAGADSWSGTIQIDRSYLTVGCNSAATSFTIGAAISGVGGVKVSNPTGKRTSITGANSYTGGTLVTGGTLLVGTSGTLGAGSVSVSSGATLDLDTGTAIADDAGVSLAKDASTFGKIDLASGVTETVGTLTLDGKLQYAGTYGATDSGARTISDDYFVGTGKLVVTGGPLRGTLMQVF